MRSIRTASLVSLLLVAGVVACEVEEERPAQLPEVQVEEGQLPEYRILKLRNFGQHFGHHGLDSTAMGGGGGKDFAQTQFVGYR